MQLHNHGITARPGKEDMLIDVNAYESNFI
jgi:hypothetical protein